jgi:hypothetical protein
MKKYENTIRLRVEFIGCDENEQKILEIKKTLGKHGNIIQISPRISKNNLLKQLKTSDLMLMTNYGKIKGVYPVKMFDYYMVRKPILLCPSDGDCIEKFIIETNSGFIANDIESCVEKLNTLIEQKIKGQPIIQNFNEEKGKFYSRQNQARILADLLKK